MNEDREFLLNLQLALIQEGSVYGKVAATDPKSPAAPFNVGIQGIYLSIAQVIGEYLERVMPPAPPENAAPAANDNPQGRKPH